MSAYKKEEIEREEAKLKRCGISLPSWFYWNVGQYISSKIQSEGWGKGTVLSLAAIVQKRQFGIRGFYPQNIWRMLQFFETYQDEPILSPLLRELPSSSNLDILSHRFNDPPSFCSR
jgi:hypothetical protein